MTFRARLTLASAAAVAIAVVAASGVVYAIVRAELRSQVDDRLHRSARHVFVPREGPLSGFSLSKPRFGGPSGYAQLVTGGGDVIRPYDARIPLPNDGARQVAAGSRDEFFEDATLEGTHVRILTTQLAPSLAVQIALPLDDVDRTLHRLAVLLTLVGLGGVGLAAAAGLLVTRAALAPVRRMTDATRHVATTQDLSRRIEGGGRDELGELAADFNRMLEALERSLAAQRGLVADASHELRTPLTSLRTNIELLARDGRISPDERKRIIDDVLAQLEELSTLVGDVVELARGSLVDEPVEDVDLAELVDEEVERARRLAPRLEFDVSLEPSVVRAAPERVARAVRNLLENAVKWSPEDGRVEVAVAGGTVSVRDHGPGIEDNDLPRVFDRFYRAPAARGLPGSGLGLAIAKETAEAYGGRAVAERPPGGGALLRLEFVPSS